MVKQLDPQETSELTDIQELRLDQKERIIKNGWSMDEWHQQYAIDLRTGEGFRLPRFAQLSQAKRW
ncbi:MAG: hypothetical protein ACK506_03680 [Pirellula sp.]